MKCPKCGCEDVKEVVYGYLPMGAIQERDEGKFVYGGLFMPEDAPNYQCMKCGERWLEKVEKAPTVWGVPFSK